MSVWDLFDREELNFEVVSALVSYDSRTGVLTWKPRPAHLSDSAANAARWNGRYAGRPALSCNNPGGYKVGHLFKKTFFAHRVAWLLYYGEWPTGEIDHINGDRTDNRISNLRDVDGFANHQNCKRRKDNSSGVNGVDFHKGLWRARIRANGKRLELGKFAAFDAAVAAREAAEIEYGYHPNHGRR